MTKHQGLTPTNNAWLISQAGQTAVKLRHFQFEDPNVVSEVPATEIPGTPIWSEAG